MGGDGVKEAATVSGDYVDVDAAVPEPLLGVGKCEVESPAAESPAGTRRGPRGGPLPDLASTPFYSRVHSPKERAPRGNKGLY